MRGRRSWTTALASLASGGLLACASVDAPGGWLPSATGALTDVHGGWVEVWHQADPSTEQPRCLEGEHWDRGELIAVDADTLLLLSEDGLVSIPASEIAGVRDFASVRVGWYENSASTPLTIVGTVSTISHGWFLVFTAPAWLIVGGTTAVVESRAPIEEADPSNLTALRPYARFPRGLPPGLDPTTLKGKDWKRQPFREGWPPREKTPQD